MIIQIDTTVETPWQLRRVASFLAAHADAVEHMATGQDPILKSMIANDTPIIPAVPGSKLGEVHGRANPTALSGAAVASIPSVPAVPEASIPTPPPVVPPVPGSSTVPAAASSSPAPTGNAERDSQGVPYDARIHNDMRTKKVDGTWKLRKGIDKTFAANIEAELRAGGTPVTVSAPAPAETVIPHVPAPTPGVPPVPTVPTVLPHSVPAATGFGDLMEKCSKSVTAGLITQLEVNQTVQAFGVANLIMLMSKPELIPQVAMAIDNVIQSKPAV